MDGKVWRCRIKVKSNDIKIKVKKKIIVRKNKYPIPIFYFILSFVLQKNFLVERTYIEITESNIFF